MKIKLTPYMKTNRVNRFRLNAERNIDKYDDNPSIKTLFYIKRAIKSLEKIIEIETAYQKTIRGSNA